MLVESERWREMYDEVVSQVRKGGGSVSLLCHSDVDALCAARLWAFALRADGVAYSVHPCFDLKGLKKKLESTQQTAVLFNVGGTVNLSTVPSSNRQIHILDSHRPFHLANVHAPHVVLWQDNDGWENDVPSDGDNLSGNESSDEESSDEESSDDDSDEEDSEGEAEFEDEEDIKKLETDKRKASTEAGLNPDYDGDVDEVEAETERDISIANENEDSIEVSLNKSNKRKRSGTDDGDRTDEIEDHEGDDMSKDGYGEDDNVKRTRGLETPPETPPETQHSSMRERHLERQRRIRTYYSGGTYYSSPVSYMAYTLLSSGLRHGSNGDLLWLACIGVTDALVHNRLDYYGYKAFSDQLSSQVHHIFPQQNDLVAKTANAFYAESIQPARRQQLDSSAERMTLVTKCETGRISVHENEFRFFLLRHLSLWNALRYSNVMSSQLELYTKAGISRLKEMLAQIGVPLTECQQPYAFLKPTLKRRIHRSLLRIAPDYGLERHHLINTGFCRVTGYQSLTSASDIVYAITALLECRQDAFNTAYDALNANASFLVTGETSTHTLSKGIRLAVWLQKAIFSAAVSLVERKAITRLTHFRYAFLHCTSHHGTIEERPQNDGTSPESTKTHIFAKPLALTKLANYLLEIHKNKWTGDKARPLVLLAEDPLNSCYWIVGFSWEKRNRFGQLFQYTAETLSLETKQVSLDSHSIQVMGGASQAQRFVEQLHYMMDSI